MSGLALRLRLGLARPVACAPDEGGPGGGMAWLTDESGKRLTDEAGNPILVEVS